MNRRLDNWISTYLRYTDTSEAPDKFHYWTAISVIAGALRRRVWMDMGHFQWTPNFYIIFVAPPGIVSKTTTANIGMNLLREIPEIHFGPESVTWQSLVQSLGNSTESFLWQDAYHPMSAVTIVSGEFGTFLNPDDREMVDVLVSLWDGQVGTFRKSTKTQGSDVVENPWVNILACTTPAWIAGHFPEYLIGGGFTSRTIFVYAEQKRKYIAYPGYEMTPEQRALREDLIHDLEVIASDIVGEYRLSPDARAWGEEWYERLYTERPEELDNDRFAGYLARKQTHLHKIAMVLTAATSNSLTITKETLQEADRQLTLVEQDMPLVFAQIGRSKQSTLVDDIITYVKRRGRVPYQQVVNKFYLRATPAELPAIITTAVNTGQIISITTQEGPMLAPAKEPVNA